MTSEPSGDSNRHPKIAVAEASGKPSYDPEMGHLQFAGRGLTRHSEGCSFAFWVYPESRATCQCYRFSEEMKAFLQTLR